MAQNPTRRHTLRLSVAAFTSLTASAAEGAGATAVSDPDSELIRLCRRIVATVAEQAVLLTGRHTLEEERRTDPAMNMLYDEREQIFDQLYDLPGPLTMDGARAMARALLALSPREKDRENGWAGEHERLAWSIAEYLA